VTGVHRSSILRDKATQSVFYVTNVTESVFYVTKVTESVFYVTNVHRVSILRV